MTVVIRHTAIICASIFVSGLFLQPVVAQTDEEAKQHFAAVSTMIDSAADEAKGIKKPVETTVVLPNKENNIQTAENGKEKETQIPLKAPTQTTLFLTNPGAASAPTSSDEVYYSSTPITFDINDASKTLNMLDTSLSDITAKVADLDRRHKSTDTKYPQIRAEVIQVINDIKKAKSELTDGLENITKYQRIVLQASQNIDTIRADIATMRKHITDFSNLLYRVHNDLYNEQGKIDDVKLFVQSDNNIADTLSSTYVVENMLTNLNALIGKLQAEEGKQIKRIKTSNQYKIAMKDEIGTYQDKITNLDQKRKYLADYLDLYASNKSKIERTSISILDTRRDIQKSITDTINEIRQKKYVTSFAMSGKLAEMRSLQPYATYERSAPLSWPIMPVKEVSTYFKDPNYKEKYDLEHYGIEVPSAQNTPVYAAADGLIYRIQKSEDLGVNRILVLHKNGIITIYLYLNTFNVAEGDIIRRGQILGTSGGEPGTPGAGFISKQPNLTFMVFDQTKFVDPLGMLDLSPISNQSLLDQKYHIKYLKDLYARARDIYKIEFLTGSTINERRVQFLETYGVGIYRELAFWQDAASETNIDLDMGICIGFAESTLGNHLSTANNIGNVGNNDRGDRISFGSALAGARLIYTTLNNVYLGHYNTIIELNGYGNKNGAKYATSPYNRQNNVVNCLSRIKGFYVPDDYPFRTDLNPNRIVLPKTEDGEQKVETAKKITTTKKEAKAKKKVKDM